MKASFYLSFAKICFRPQTPQAMQEKLTIFNKACLTNTVTVTTFKKNVLIVSFQVYQHTNTA